VLTGLASLVNAGTIEVQSGSLQLGASSAISGTGTLKIDAGATLEITSGVSSGQTVDFTGTTGKLILDNPSSFSGQIAGVSGSGQVLDFHGFSAATTTAVTSAGSYDSVHNVTTLTVTDTSDSLTETFKLAGNLSGSSWTVTDDTHGGVNIVDPPAGQSVGPVVMNDPGPSVLSPMIMQDPGPAAPGNTVVATAANQTLSGFAPSDNFVFNFAGVGHTAVTNFLPLSDTLQFSNSIFANALSVLNATQDDGHGNTVISIDSHDSITLGGVQKVQLHVADFHIV
jgi:hypothetical protein